MEGPADAVSLLIIVANGLVSLKGFSDFVFFDRYLFDVEGILRRRETYRILTSGFLHANWPHVIFNMFALYSFGGVVGETYGLFGYCLVYFGSLIAGSLLALYLRRDDQSYRAVGASGAVSGVIFAFVVASPEGAITFVFLPVLIPAWIFGIGFVLISIFGIGSRGAGVRRGGIGHEAHLGGAMAGVCLGLLLRPEFLIAHPLVVASIIALMAFFLLVAVRKPGLLDVRGYMAGWREEAGRRRRQTQRKTLQHEMDRLLDKVNERGVGSLTRKERDRLRCIAKMKNAKRR